MRVSSQSYFEAFYDHQARNLNHMGVHLGKERQATTNTLPACSSTSDGRVLFQGATQGQLRWCQCRSQRVQHHVCYVMACETVKTLFISSNIPVPADRRSLIILYNMTLQVFVAPEDHLKEASLWDAETNPKFSAVALIANFIDLFMLRHTWMCKKGQNYCNHESEIQRFIRM